MTGHRLTEEEIDKLLSSKPIVGSEFIAGAVYIILVVIAIIMFFCSCSTTKSMSHESYAECHRENISKTSDVGITNISSRKDSIIMEKAQADSVMMRQTVKDSTVINNTIETVITNTVKEDGTLLGTDRITTKTISRDHWRIENNDTQSTHKNVENTLAKSVNQDSVNVWSNNDSIVSHADSINSQVEDVKVVEKQSLWMQIQNKVSGVVAVIIVLSLLYLFVNYGYKYLRGK